MPPCARTTPAAREDAPDPAWSFSRTTTRSAPKVAPKYEAQPPIVPAPTTTRSARSRFAIARTLPGRGAALFAIVGAAGIGVYLAAIAIGVNRFVVPAPPLGHWWTVPVLFLNAAQAALLEEVIVVGYLITRLQQLGWSAVAAIAGSA